MFRSSLLASALAVFGLAIPGSPALAAVSLIVVNENSFSEDAIMEVYVSPVDADGWGPDRLGSPVPLGEYREIDLSSFGDRLCRFDVLIVDEDNESYEYPDVDLCNNPPYIYFSE